MSYIQSVARETPSTTVKQDEVREFAKAIFKNSSLDIERYLPVFEHSKIKSRPVLKDISWYGETKSFKDKNELFVIHATEMAEKSARLAIEKANLLPSEIDIIIVVTSSGFVTPTLDARLIDLLGLSTDVKRIPIIGLGCAGGANSIARAGELSTLYPDKNILVITVETCTLTFRPADKRKSNLIALSLFSDGSSSMIVSGKEKKKSIQIKTNASRKWRNSLDVMGWEIEMDGLQVVFDKSIPGLIAKNFLEFYMKFINQNKIKKEDIKHHLFHPGGAKVIEAFSNALEIGEDNFYYSMKVLQEYGNISSPTIFFVIEEFLKEQNFSSGEHGLFSAMGPGFSSDIILFTTT
ncbi:MAG TPA: 3-oxoacyl-[acyl-carrier-protein] synthase III C-terminal domain-containing protein [Leptospiraceae bacterium]|nr:3-oxoacyl-[acyl-carrier-protein] synthase III C-terminal domain-containing protein [Leptospiraceae bacterium]HRG75622.1 3-oxoacyl-[acyl-carrier-protein] synthase III C-terminal domain-containing protein [Leptospiraceae bacterium]